MKIFTIVFLFFVFSTSAEELVDCDKPWTTRKVNQCMSIDLKNASILMEKYLSKGKERFADDHVVLQSISEAQNAWKEYKKQHCSALYDIWRKGSIKDSMSIGCSIELTYQRTFDIWKSLLTYVDSTPPVLPEPPKYVAKRY